MELTEKACAELWRRYKEDGDQPARERLVLAHVPLVKRLAWQMARSLPSHIEKADLLSCGVIGLIAAVERFDRNREVAFETFARRRIRGAMVDELRSLDWAPRSTRSAARVIKAATSELERQLMRAPRDREIADAMGTPVAQLRETRLRAANASVLAFEERAQLTASGERGPPLERIADPGAVDPAEALGASETRDNLAAAIADLPKHERLVVALYYYDELSPAEIGEIIGLSESRVSQLRAKAVGRLRRSLQAGIGPCGRLGLGLSPTV